jgi:hypothetical protein
MQQKINLGFVKHAKKNGFFLISPITAHSPTQKKGSKFYLFLFFRAQNTPCKIEEGSQWCNGLRHAFNISPLRSRTVRSAKKILENL